MHFFVPGCCMGPSPLRRIFFGAQLVLPTGADQQVENPEDNVILNIGDNRKRSYAEVVRGMNRNRITHVV